MSHFVLDKRILFIKQMKKQVQTLQVCMWPNHFKITHGVGSATLMPKHTTHILE
jgi:hypothetical protein